VAIAPRRSALLNTHGPLDALVARVRLSGEHDEETDPELRARLLELRQDVHQLVAWMEEAEERIDRHFDSWSWKIGHLVVGVARRLARREHRPARDFTIQRIFSDFRRWRELHLEPEPRADTGQDLDGAQVAFLAGDLADGGAADVEVLRGERLPVGPVCVVGFLPEGRALDPALRAMICRVRRLDGFPGGFRPLCEALLSLAAAKLIVVRRPDLLSLGLGFLAHFHFGVPLARWKAEQPSGEVIRFEADVRAPAFLDPRSGAWRELLAPAYLELPGVADPPRELPVAAQFAEWFALFHAGSERAVGLAD